MLLIANLLLGLIEDTVRLLALLAEAQLPLEAGALQVGEHVQPGVYVFHVEPSVNVTEDSEEVAVVVFRELSMH